MTLGESLIVITVIFGPTVIGILLVLFVLFKQGEDE